MEFYYLLLILTLHFIQPNFIRSKLIFVFEHVRHGTRTPPFDEDSNYIDQFGTQWEGDGELTPIGKRMHYILGVKNRFKYSSLIDFHKFNPKEIQIFTTNSVRTLKSLEAELHGMYLPGTADILTPEELEIAWPPGKEYLSEEVLKEVNNTLDNNTVINGINLFPIQFYPDGKVFLNEPDHCPYMETYRKILEERTNKTLTEFMKKFDEKYGDKLTEYLQRPNKDYIYTFGSLIDVTDNYICNIDNGKDLSDFLTKTGFVREEFHEAAIEIKKFYLFHLSSDETAGLIGATPHMKDLIYYMEKKIENENKITYSEPKMVIQGGHDTTINVIQFFMHKAFGFPTQYIKFGANIFFELHKDEINNKYIVKYFYDGEQLLEKEYYSFKEIVLKTAWSDKQIHDFCFQEEDNNNEDKDNNKLSLIILIITNIIFIITTGIFLILYLRSKKNNSELNEKFNNNQQLIE